MGPGRRLGNEYNLDFRDDRTNDAPTILRFGVAIDHAYDADSLALCNEGWGGIDGVRQAKHLIEQCYLFDVDASEFPETYQAMLDCKFID